ncbi:MAG TPA: TVP38/TMEM64 family protein [Selenomonadales bacterium]|nr:TVP38/TMEM64 family protein [Selenomonadales bacterium]
MRSNGEPCVDNNRRLRIRLVVVLGALLLAAALVQEFGLAAYITLENLAKLKGWIDGYGLLGPVIYIALFIVAAVFFLPGLPLGILAGVVFGPIKGAVCAAIGGTLGAVAAFLIARYAAREMVEGWILKNKRLSNLDQGVRRHGWRMLVITRLVPLFPYNLQNYAYGLTDIPLSTYFLVSLVCMLPATVAFSFAGGSMASGGDIRVMLLYLGIAGVFFVFISLLPGWLKKKHGKAMDLS